VGLGKLLKWVRAAIKLRKEDIRRRKKKRDADTEERDKAQEEEKERLSARDVALQNAIEEARQVLLFIFLNLIFPFRIGFLSLVIPRIRFSLRKMMSQK
jgi:hypothetical protein